MLIESCIKLMLGLIYIGSITSIIIAVDNKNKDKCRWITYVNLAFIFYIITLAMLPNMLYLPVGLELLLYGLASFVAIILNIISVIINTKKAKKLKGKAALTIDKKVRYFAIAVIAIPFVAVAACLIDNVYTIRSSELILAYRSAGNGGFGDTDYFAFGVKDGRCRQFDLGADFNGYKLKQFLPKSAHEVAESDLHGYEVSYKDGVFTAHKDGKQICSVATGDRYFNIDLERVYYNQH